MAGRAPGPICISALGRGWVDSGTLSPGRSLPELPLGGEPDGPLRQHEQPPGLLQPSRSRGAEKPAEQAKAAKPDKAAMAKMIKQAVGSTVRFHPLRRAYEAEVKALAASIEEMDAKGRPDHQIASIANQKRRNLGMKYKALTPQPLLDFVHERNLKLYGDRMGPTTPGMMRRKQSQGYENPDIFLDIMESAVRPNKDIDKVLAPFEAWLARQDLEYLENALRLVTDPDVRHV